MLNPARIPIVERTMVTSDSVFRTCVHEIARALEQLTTPEEVPLYATRVEFDEAAIKIAGFLSAQKCGLKGGHG